MNSKNLLLFLTIVCLLSAQQCDLQDPQKVDCGFMGIDQSQC